MATIATNGISALQRERAFFFYMSLAILATVLAGFGFFFAIGASTIHSPWWVHLHAMSMGTWVLLFVAQNFLVYRGNVTAHRTLGPLAAAWSVWIFALGVVVTVADLKTHRVPPFFTPNYFLMMDWLNMVAFAGLAWTALRLRNRSDWHRRLMTGAVIQLLAVAWGRLIFPLTFDQRAIFIVLLALLGYFAVGMAWDKRHRGEVHPAWLWGAGALVGWVSLSYALAGLPPVLALAKSFTG